MRNLQSILLPYGLEVSVDLSNAFTDFLFAVLTMTFFLVLEKKLTAPHRYWRCAFLFLGLSTFIGGVAHAQQWYHGRIIHVAGWIVSAASLYCIERASLNELAKPRLVKYLTQFIAVQFFVFVITAVLVQDFKVVEVNGGIGLFGIVFPIFTTRYVRHREKEALFLLLGILSLIVPGVLFNRRGSPEKGLDHVDMSHLCLLLTVTLLFIGVKGILHRAGDE